MEQCQKAKLGHLWPALVLSIMLFNVFIVDIDCKGKDIERKILSSKRVLSSSTDSFENSQSYYCSYKKDFCTQRNAKCSSSCCTCLCLDNMPNFYSIEKGCISTTVITKMSDTKCRYGLTKSESYIPTFSKTSGYRDFHKSNLMLISKLDPVSVIMKSASCVAKSIYYINSNGEVKKIIENKCSEVIAISSKKKLSNGENTHQLSWKYTGHSDAAWQKLAGKLLKIEISCSSSSLKQKVSSCLLFKVAGKYNDNLPFSLLKSASVCPTTDGPQTDNLPTKSLQTTLNTFFTRNATTELLRPATFPPAGSTKKKKNGMAKPHQLPDKSNDKKGISLVVIGLIIGCVFLLSVMAIAFMFLLRKRYQRQRLLQQAVKGAFSIGDNGNGAPKRDLPEVPCSPGNEAAEANLYDHIECVRPTNNGGYQYLKNNAQAPKIYASDNNCNPRQLTLITPLQQEQPIRPENEYASPASFPQEHSCEFPDDQQYTDMSLGGAAETRPLFTDVERYENVDNCLGPIRPKENEREASFYEAVDPEAVPSDSEVYLELMQEIEYENLKI